MRSAVAALCLCVALLLCRGALSQSRTGASSDQDLLAVNVLDLSGAIDSLLRSEQQRALTRQIRGPARLVLPPKRNQQGSRFALSLDVPTSILSVLIDLAKNQDMRTKAAANAQLMARIGRR